MYILYTYHQSYYFSHRTYVLQESFFDPEHHNGYLEWRLRNEKRKLTSGKNPKQDIKETKKRKLSTTDQENNPHPEKKFKKEEIMDMIKWINHACIKTDKDEIFQKMRYTLEYRMSLKGEKSLEMLKLFPKFIDIPQSVHNYFIKFISICQSTDY